MLLIMDGKGAGRGVWRQVGIPLRGYRNCAGPKDWTGGRPCSRLLKSPGACRNQLLRLPARRHHAGRVHDPAHDANAGGGAKSGCPSGCVSRRLPPCSLWTPLCSPTCPKPPCGKASIERNDAPRGLFQQPSRGIVNCIRTFAHWRGCQTGGAIHRSSLYKNLTIN